MALTRAAFESVLIARTGKLLEKVGKDGLTQNGTNPDLNEPMGYAVRTSGGAVVDLTALADADLSGFAASTYDQLFDLAEYRTLENIAGNIDFVDVRAGPLSEALGQLATNLEKRIDRLQKKIANDYDLFVKTAGLEVFSEYDT